VHELWRVFADRLIDDKDRMFLLNQVREITRVRFGLNFDNVFIHLDKTINGQKDGKIDSLDEIRGLM
jgi:dynein heavy chain